MSQFLPTMLLASLSLSASEVRSEPMSRVTSDEAAPLPSIDTFFAAVKEKNRSAILSNVVPEGLATSIRIDGGPRMRSWHWATYVEQVVAGNPEAFDEKLFTPEVRIERDIAMVWARYELMVGGKFSHCGVNHFDMVRRDGRWLIYNLTWTNQTKNCLGR